MSSRLDALNRRTILLDCRFLGRGGPGRATELLLRGLTDLQPSGRWLLWGPPAAQRFVWSGAEWHAGPSSPTALWGQVAPWRIPLHDVAFYLHQIRPLVGRASVTLIHDTIPLRYGGGPGARTFKKVYLKAAARLSRKVLTVSSFSRSCIERDLRTPSDRISIVSYPVDEAMATRVQRYREGLPQQDRLLYVGRFGPHKNLRRLLQAFQKTALRRKGGTLLLVGGSLSEVRELSRHAAGDPSVVLRGNCTQDELERLYATSVALVQPSLEEGFGLPAWEALACRLPVCISSGGALPELSSDLEPFPADDVEAMAAAIDRCIERGPVTVPSGPSPVEFAEECAAILAKGF